jgi:hypothetical protein
LIYPIIAVDQVSDVVSLLKTLTEKTAAIYDKLDTLSSLISSVVDGEGAFAVKNNLLHPALNVIFEV